MKGIFVISQQKATEAVSSFKRCSAFVVVSYEETDRLNYIVRNKKNSEENWPEWKFCVILRNSSCLQYTQFCIIYGLLTVRKKSDVNFQTRCSRKSGSSVFFIFCAKILIDNTVNFLKKIMCGKSSKFVRFCLWENRFPLCVRM